VEGEVWREEGLGLKDYLLVQFVVICADEEKLFYVPLFPLRWEKSSRAWCSLWRWRRRHRMVWLVG
jgi:hypothetical protein